MAAIARFLVSLGVLIAFAGCQTFDVRTDYDPAASYDRMQRFEWVEPPEHPDADPFADNDLLRNRVRAAIKAELARRGFLAADDRASADFLVTYSVMLEERMRVDGVSTGYGARTHRRYGWGGAFTSANVRAFQESVLIIDLLDSTTEELVWRGWGTGMLRTRDRDRSLKRLAAGVRAIFDEFPPGADSDA